MSKPIFLKKKRKKKRKKNIINLWSAELAQRVVKVNIDLLKKKRKHVCTHIKGEAHHRKVYIMAMNRAMETFIYVPNNQRTPDKC